MAASTATVGRCRAAAAATTARTEIAAARNRVLVDRFASATAAHAGTSTTACIGLRIASALTTRLARCAGITGGG